MLILSLVRDRISGMANPDRENLALVLALSRTHQVFMRAIAKVFREEGITAPQWDVIETLYSKGPLTVNELMASILSTSGSLDVVLTNLCDAGLITKQVCELDRRSRIVALTSSGRVKVDDFYPRHNAALEDIFGAVPRADRRRSVHELNRLRRAINNPTETVIA